MWQTLYESLKDQDFVVIAIAMESRGEQGARPVIERYKPTYPCLIDRSHLVSDLYNMINVPQAVWIDEEGRIVRPVEISGSSASRDAGKREAIRKLYCDAINDWVHKGSDSEFVFDETGAQAHLPENSEDIALAHAHFRLGQRLWERGDKEQGAEHLLRSTELSPDSWNMYRQMKNLEHIMGSASKEWMDRVKAFTEAGKRYYPAPDMPGMLELAKSKSKSKSSPESR